MIDPHKPYFLTAPTDPHEEKAVLKEMVLFLAGHPQAAAKIMPPIIELMKRNELMKDDLPAELLAAVSQMLPEVGTPARNDYHIARWTLLGEDADLLYLINKARELTGEQRQKGNQHDMGATTAHWAIFTISQNGQRFKADILRLAGEDGPWLTTAPTIGG